MIKIIKDEVKDVDLRPVDEFINDIEKSDFHGRPGEQHYKLLGYISQQFTDTKLIDIGTRRGSSAVALSLNSSNKVVSYDIKKWPGADAYVSPPINVKYLIEDLVCVDGITSAICGYSPFIMLDIDPHEGNREKLFIDLLDKYNYKGILLLDDISSLWPGMLNMWNSLSSKFDNMKYDLTDIGHFSGTHILDFSQSLEII